MASRQEKHGGKHAFVQGALGVRYQVKDVARSVAFYATHLGFTLEHQQLPAFGNVSLGDAQILLSGHKRRDLGGCRTVSSRNQADGTVSCTARAGR